MHIHCTYKFYIHIRSAHTTCTLCTCKHTYIWGMIHFAHKIYVQEWHIMCIYRVDITFLTNGYSLPTSSSTNFTSNDTTSITTNDAIPHTLSLSPHTHTHTHQGTATPLSTLYKVSWCDQGLTISMVIR